MGTITVKAKRIRLFISLCFLGSMVAMIGFATQGCSNQPVKAWHIENLTEEFTVDRAAEIQTFDQYRQLEDRLFQQLEQKVYAHTGTGPEYALVRYSKGSAADPRIHKPDWNRSFELTAERRPAACLLLHGMSDSPYSLRAIGADPQPAQLLGARPAPARPRHGALGTDPRQMGGHGRRRRAERRPPGQQVGQNRSTSSAIPPAPRWR